MVPKGEPFDIFVLEHRINLLKSCRCKKIQTIQAFVAKKAERRWQTMLPEEKDPFEQVWTEAKGRYGEMLAAFLKKGGCFWGAATRYGWNLYPLIAIVIIRWRLL